MPRVCLSAIWKLTHTEMYLEFFHFFFDGFQERALWANFGVFFGKFLRGGGTFDNFGKKVAD